MRTGARNRLWLTAFAPAIHEPNGKLRVARVMSIDFSQKERAFVEELRADTGRDLDGWMTAIKDAGLGSRNEIIDWLRHEGFTFARASWLERIHHNDGRLIYGPAPVRPAELHKRKPAAAKPEPVRPAVAAASPSGPVLPRPVAQTDGDIDALLASAKAYRPLAQVLLRDVLATVPGADARTLSGHIVVSHTRPFAALLPGPKDVRLMLALGTRSPGADWGRSKFAGGLDSLAALTHMLVLTDARQLTRELKDLVAASARDTGN